MPSPQFEHTRWSIIQRVTGSDSAMREQAWREFHEIYRQPLFWFVRSQGWNETDADDLLQDFLSKLAEKEWLAEANPSEVKMRTFLLLRLKRHLNDVRKYRKAQKRGGGVETVPTHEAEPFLSDEAPDPGDKVQMEFDRHWAQAIIDRSLQQLKQYSEARGKATMFEVLESQLTDEQPELIKQAANQLGRSEGAMRMALQRLRDRLRTIVRNEVAETLPPGADLDEEVRYLASLLG